VVGLKNDEYKDSLATWLARLDALREILTADRRSVVQGALGWLWARSEALVPVPGFGTVAQVEENAAALEFGPLKEAQMVEIRDILSH
jgi:aryl-alcohol dehydrogenase-like predicted oxidoreductase